MLRWSRPSTWNDTYNEVVVVGNVLYYGSAGRIVARDTATGNLRWATPASEPIGQPSVANGVVYTAVAGNSLQAIDAASGHVKWTIRVGSTPSIPATANGIVYVAAGGLLHAFDAATGTSLRTAPGSGRPEVANGMVYLGADIFAP